jgi:glucose/arabinose dehydrogenase
MTMLRCCLTLSLIAASFAALAAAEPPKLAAVLVCDGIASPTWVGTPPGERDRLFVLEQRTGAVRIFDCATKAWRPQPVLTVAPLASGGNEQGLLGLAFHPDFAKNGFFYLYYTAPGGGSAGHAEIARFTLVGEQADPASKQVVLNIDQPEENHNGGWISFGPDRFLWLGVGDGGGGNDHHGPIGSGQNRQSLLGKLLRLDVDSATPYGIPKDNPFVDQLGKRPEIAAFGLRNPWRCSFDAKTGDVWIGDVGQNAREEIDRLPAGKLGLNFGWRPREGTIATKGWEKEQPVTKATEPVLDYDRAQGRVSVTGGYVYRGKAIPGLNGWYIYADFAAQRFYRIDAEAVREGATAKPVEITEQVNPGRQNGQPSTFGTDSNGELFYSGWGTGRIYQIIAAP